ncbi:hypothetical protein [Thauera humireducens]|uniref:hypothetical protein n=1 Tax=Thauera humireducens TaxID=1134435 RepID=UPI00311DE605
MGLIQEALAALTEIRESAENSLRLSDGIQLATREQASAAAAIAGSVEDIARRAEDSAMAVTGIADTSRGLAEVSSALDAALARVKV